MLIIRVGTFNNFNGTQKEFNQLNSMAKKSNDKFFINSNIKSISPYTANRINENNYKIVITINPDIEVKKEYLKKLKLIDKSKIGFIRLKYVSDYNHMKTYNQLVKMGYNVILTVMRFRHKSLFNDFVSDKEKYIHSRGYFRLKKKYYPKNALICDKKEKGCKACKFCSIFTYGIKSEIKSLNLSSSGYCKFNCPDCFAKFNAIRSKGIITMDKIYKNRKQK